MDGTVQLLGIILSFIIIKESCGVDGTATLDVSPRILGKSGDNVTVSWTGVSHPSTFDFLGIYSPADSDNANYIGWIELSSTPSWESGAGSVEIPVVNMRTPVQFRLFGGRAINVTQSTPMDEDGNPLPPTDTRLAVSPTIEFANDNEPLQIHLALTSDPREMRVMFLTRDGLESFVRFGLGRESLSSLAKATSETYTQGEMCDGPANTVRGWRDPGVIHDAVLKNLAPSMLYFYQVGSEEGGWSDVYSFVLPDALAAETNALLFGDMGTTAPYSTFLWLQRESQLTLQGLQREVEELKGKGKGTFISHIGDISYARGYQWLWDEFFHRIEPVASQAAYHVCIGNHEYDWPAQPWKPEFSEYGTDGGGECGVPYSLKFHMPGNSSLATGTAAPATRNLYYSLSVGVVHFLYISTETNFLKGSDQYNFINEDLGKVDRQKTPFIIVLGHRPMYTTDNDAQSFTYKFKDKMIENLEPLFLTHKVNVVLWGHVHKYERTCPIQNFTCTSTDASAFSQGPVHVVIGMGGQDWQPNWQPRRGHADDPIFPQPQWSLYRGDEFGYVRLHATKRSLTLTYVGNRDGQVHDVIEIPANGEALMVFPKAGLQPWTVLWFLFALVLGAGIGALLTQWRIRSSQGSQNVLASPTSYSKVSNEEGVDSVEL